MSWMRAPTRPWRLSAPLMAAATISAWAFSAPAGAPSSQSQVRSKTGPSVRCNSSALPISFSLPAKCSQAGRAGKGFVSR